jgi:hypothetical protein
MILCPPRCVLYSNVPRNVEEKWGCIHPCMAKHWGGSKNCRRVIRGPGRRNVPGASVPSKGNEQAFIWGCKSSGMWLFIAGWVVFDVSNLHNFFILSVKQSSPSWNAWSLKMKLRPTFRKYIVSSSSVSSSPVLREMIDPWRRYVRRFEST